VSSFDLTGITFAAVLELLAENIVLDIASSGLFVLLEYAYGALIVPVARFLAFAHSTAAKNYQKHKPKKLAQDFSGGAFVATERLLLLELVHW
jgi:hypothetical protein